MIKLGLIGFPLGHSFSKNYYLQKFINEGIQGINYDLYAVEHIDKFYDIFKDDYAYKGFNVTIPHKQNVLKYIDELSDEAKEINAVNCITIHRHEGKIKLKGYNTDAFGFRKSLEPLLQSHHSKALVLGNGGAAKAVFYSLKQLNIPFTTVSGSKENGDLTYDELTEELIKDFKIIINCSPIGTFPDVEKCPDIPYQALTSQHLLYDLIYNPEETLFLKKGKEKGALTKNGYEMLILQAEKNWEIWKSNF